MDEGHGGSREKVAIPRNVDAFRTQTSDCQCDALPSTKDAAYTPGNLQWEWLRYYDECRDDCFISKSKELFLPTSSSKYNASANVAPLYLRTRRNVVCAPLRSLWTIRHVDRHFPNQSATSNENNGGRLDDNECHIARGEIATGLATLLSLSLSLDTPFVWCDDPKWGRLIHCANCLATNFGDRCQSPKSSSPVGSRWRSPRVTFRAGRNEPVARSSESRHYMDKKLYIVLCLLLLCITFSPRHHQGSAWAITSQSATTKLLSFPSTESPSATSFFFPPCCSCLFLSTVPLKDPRREEITSPGTQGAPILHRNKLRGFCFIAKEKCRHARTIRSRNGPNRLPFSFSLFSCKKRI